MKRWRKLMKNGAKNHASNGWGNSKMSGEEPPLEVHYSQDKTQEQFRSQSSPITQAKFLFLIQIQVRFTRGGTPYL